MKKPRITSELFRDFANHLKSGDSRIGAEAVAENKCDALYREVFDCLRAANFDIREDREDKYRLIDGEEKAWTYCHTDANGVCLSYSVSREPSDSPSRFYFYTGTTLEDRLNRFSRQTKAILKHLKVPETQLAKNRTRVVNQIVNLAEKIYLMEEAVHARTKAK